MSRIGKMPVDIPDKVTVEIKGNLCKVTGPKGSLTQKIDPDMKVEVKDNQILVSRASDQKRHKALHGLTRSLIANMVKGVVDGFEKQLQIVGVGYSAEMQGTTLKLNLGYSHPIIFIPPEGISIEVPETTKINIKGIDKHLVGQVAAKIRSFKKPEPYKGKGIRYIDEVVRRKAGKTVGAK